MVVPRAVPRLHCGALFAPGTVCHQIQDDGLGTPASFTGGFVIGTDKQIFGPHSAPFAMPMINGSGFTPVYSTHVQESELCATCHTVITQALDESGAPVGPAFPEQVPYLEWSNSDFGPTGSTPATCQDCHMPSADAEGRAYRSAISTRPGWLDAREPLARHTFRGANSYVLGLVAENAEWVGTDVDPARFRTAAAESDANLQTAATVSVESLATEGDQLVAQVLVTNHSGHRFPTAYPTRRAWLRISGLDAGGEVVWESGSVNARGEIVAADGTRLDGPEDAIPHRDEISAEDEVMVWHTEMADMAGARTHVLLHAAGYVVDNRILPRGWSPGHEDAAMTSPVGTDGDDDFVAGSDGVTVRIPRASGAVRVRVELLFQTVPPFVVDAMGNHPTPTYTAVHAMVDARPATPSVVDTAEAAL